MSDLTDDNSANVRKEANETNEHMPRKHVYAKSTVQDDASFRD